MHQSYCPKRPTISARCGSLTAYTCHMAVQSGPPSGPVSKSACWRGYRLTDLPEGSTWPEEGEIDIIEGINNQAANQVALHADAAE